MEKLPYEYLRNIPIDLHLCIHFNFQKLFNVLLNTGENDLSIFFLNFVNIGFDDYEKYTRQLLSLKEIFSYLSVSQKRQITMCTETMLSMIDLMKSQQHEYMPLFDYYKETLDYLKECSEYND